MQFLLRNRESQRQSSKKISARKIAKKSGNQLFGIHYRNSANFINENILARAK
jgi:hypothetical protein